MANIFTAVVPQVHTCSFECDSKYNELMKKCDKYQTHYNLCYVSDQAKGEALKTLENQKVWFQKNQLAYEEKIRVLKRDLEVTSNELKFCEKEKAKVELEKQELQDKLDKEVALHKEWLVSGDKLSSFLYGSQSVTSEFGLGF
jgi:chromosome segregation ATPase